MHEYTSHVDDVTDLDHATRAMHRAIGVDGARPGASSGGAGAPRPKDRSPAPLGVAAGIHQLLKDPGGTVDALKTGLKGGGKAPSVSEALGRAILSPGGLVDDIKAGWKALSG